MFVFVFVVIEQNKNVQLSLTNPRDAKPCQKFLQLEVKISSSQIGNPVFSNVDCCKTIITILADRTNGRAYATALSSVCDVCIVPQRCVLEQKLLLTAYRKSYMRNLL